MKRVIILFVTCIFSFCAINGQTHAEATSQKWKGTDISEIIGNPQYDETLSGGGVNGFPMILYNVGTGCFVIQGGDWGIEGRLFYSDFGREMYLYSSGRINSMVTEENVSDTKNSFGVNVPKLTKGNGWGDVDKYCYTTIMDGPKEVGGIERHWIFVRVEEETNNDTYTYYMYESLKGNNIPQKNYYLGACYGEWGDARKGIGNFVFLDDDRTCWTTANVIGNDSIVTLENGDNIEIQKLYQWRVISIDEYLDMLNNENIGINPSMSSLIPDRDFTRNSDDFHGNWITDILDNYSYGSDKRYTYSYGNYIKNTNQQSRIPRLVDEAWDTPTKLKVAFDQFKSLEDSKKNSKFGYMNFEGVGTVSTTFEIPKPGWYQIECVGFIQSDNNHDAYLFARVIDDNMSDQLEHTLAQPTTNETWYSQVVLHKVESGTYNKGNVNGSLEIGKELLYNAEKYRQKVWVLITEEDFNNGKKTIRIGIKKEQATKSKKINNGYYDTDIVCIDDFKMSYMGIVPAFFYEDKEDLEYLRQGTEDYNNYEFISSSNNGIYSGAVCLERKFITNEWNTFSFPLPLTGEQVRYAFGDKTQLLKLNSIGRLSNNECIIDFETVNLVTLDNVVLPNHIYLIKPISPPVIGEDPRGNYEEYYTLGRMTFSTNSNDIEDNFLDLNILYSSQDVPSYQDRNNGIESVSYCQTPNFTTFSVTNGIYNGMTAPSGSYVPKGSYAISYGKMYELNKDTRIKGFRGWITLTHSVFEQTSDIHLKMSINGIIDNEITTHIDVNNKIIINNEDKIYDLTGKVVNLKHNLPKGIYIIGNKKVLVK